MIDHLEVEQYVIEDVRVVFWTTVSYLDAEIDSDNVL